MFLEISQISQENTCARAFFNKVTSLSLQFIKRETLAQVFLTMLFTEHLGATTSVWRSFTWPQVDKRIVVRCTLFSLCVVIHSSTPTFGKYFWLCLNSFGKYKNTIIVGKCLNVFGKQKYNQSYVVYGKRPIFNISTVYNWFVKE